VRKRTEDNSPSTCFFSTSRALRASLASRRRSRTVVSYSSSDWLLTVYFGAPSMFITLWFGFDYGTNPPLGALII
jgi:hypothetical protein